jgi:hypothetical protein
LLPSKNGGSIWPHVTPYPSGYRSQKSNLLHYHMNFKSRWSTFLADYDFEIIIVCQHMKANLLSRRSELELTLEDEGYIQKS